MPEFDFIKAAYGRPHDRVPIWIMRQAGRYLPEYQEVRQKVSFLELCHSPELVAKVTRQPIEIFGFDAAIMFSDILLPLAPMGFKISYDNGGPTVRPALRNPEHIAHLKTFDPAEEMNFVLRGIKAIKDQLDGIVPLIGFAGSPFTMLCYMVEGGGSFRFTEIKKFIYSHPREARVILDRIAEMTGHYLKAQIESGVDAIQVFDSWGGILPPDAYLEYSFKSLQTVFEICAAENIPRILYLNNSAPYLDQLAGLNCEVIGIDWRTDLKQALDILDGKAVQGNLDPHLLMGDRELLYRETMNILETASAKDNFIFNLGHGIQPETPVDNVKFVVDTVHGYKIPENK